MSTTKRNVKFSLKILNVLRVVALCVVRFILKLYYGTEGKKMPAIRERIIREPAMKLAKKIRDREHTEFASIHKRDRKCAASLAYFAAAAPASSDLAVVRAEWVPTYTFVGLGFSTEIQH
ncbi:hypothetical protein EVAR_26819_1 [Eumeta japonica]|uniref:Uncharacterized protein n=1 Tax=Eumeta variegata TaxID=151549 RepID=A0A4C1WDZ5_EUMVA|nr:hypothetical protein EVAR_26819_1 [Eumeta japonica]